MFQRTLWEHGRDAFLSAMVVTREFGLIGEWFSKAQSLDEMLVEKADYHYKTFWQCCQIRVWKALKSGLCFLRYKMNFVKSRSYD